jgi:PhnB protein
MNENQPTVAFSLTVKNGSEALDFYTRAFGAEELYRMPTPDGGVAHCEFTIGHTRIYLSDESPEWHAEAMPEGSKASCLFSIATDSCDDSFRRAVEAGGQALNKPRDQFWGSRSAMVLDPFGYRWSFSEIIEEVSPEEMQRRANELFGG